MYPNDYACFISLFNHKNQFELWMFFKFVQLCMFKLV